MKNFTQRTVNDEGSSLTFRDTQSEPDQWAIKVVVGEGSIGDVRDIEAITETLRSAAQAVERGDSDGVAAMFYEDEGTVLFDYLEPGLSTIADIRRNVSMIAKNATGEVICRYPKITVRILSDDLAYSMAYSKIVVATADGRTDNHTRVTNIWRRINGRWLAIHEHSSVPVNPVTGQADLKQSI